MSADEYWHGPPALVKSYHEANKLRVRHENELAWMQGAYFMNAVQVALGNSFNKKGSKKNKYMEKPFDLGLETDAEKRVKAQRERDKIIAKLTMWKQSWERRNKSGEKS